ncbi:MAG: winged helix-turn-helix domain-containing protein [Candidatus Bathyarchaeota archaeon]|jgi:predicted ArsR family transcriptional regulator
MKILKVLHRVGQLNVSEITKRVGENYVKTKRHLMVLEKEEIVQHRMYGRTQLYKLNRQSTKSRAVQKLIEAWSH